MCDTIAAESIASEFEALNGLEQNPIRQANSGSSRSYGIRFQGITQALYLFVVEISPIEGQCP